MIKIKTQLQQVDVQLIAWFAPYTCMRISCCLCFQNFNAYLVNVQVKNLMGELKVPATVFELDSMGGKR